MKTSAATWPGADTWLYNSVTRGEKQGHFKWHVKIVRRGDEECDLCGGGDGDTWHVTRDDVSAQQPHAPGLPAVAQQPPQLQEADDQQARLPGPQWWAGASCFLNVSSLKSFWLTSLYFFCFEWGYDFTCVCVCVCRQLSFRLWWLLSQTQKPLGIYEISLR